jgi:hypothetical protein
MCKFLAKVEYLYLFVKFLLLHVSIGEGQMPKKFG